MAEIEKPKTIDDKIDEMLLEKRRIFLSDAVTSESVEKIIRKLWYLESLDNTKPIVLVINSPGGSIDAGFALWDQMKMMKSPVTTLVTGVAASMGSILSLCAAPGKRLATPRARIMIHQPSIHGIIEGQATDLEIQAREIIKMRKSLIAIYVEATGKKAEDIDKIIDRDSWMTAQEALDFGLLDAIVDDFDKI
ncbi:MAG: ATP-dependent Clp protease proteolytic subunit [Waddliaceae bacterium]|jgi:ATP-dependent Clp protease, protease subunit|nr:ATP-dependent Clp protease proteolytic subunit [Waddliaceae bacterium]MBT3579134.1 ATP-dependent Clp protease proteolytic subunit [Waddliaceae bacterium]MBT4444887.1 ATP-dependent Clp protease proteolytic subunit [Waddliaceae bacterium]MBT6927920.1 ATP-dependent Clp protease proteolytic subunit [Waddliaceae bacterium]MBT7264786.1 ATP-dependent Clp protease proteolytic subunit [Waddliaceae bacterium]